MLALKGVIRFEARLSSGDDLKPCLELMLNGADEQVILPFNRVVVKPPPILIREQVSDAPFRGGVPVVVQLI